MTTIKVQLITLITICFFSYYCSSYLHSKENKVNQAVIALDEIIEIMKNNYFDQTYGGLNWVEICYETRKKIEESDDQKKAYLHIKELLKQLKHSHIELTPQPKYRENIKNKIELKYGTAKDLPFDFVIQDQKMIIYTLKENSQASQAGLKLGHIITKIGEIPVADLLADGSIYSSIFQYLFRYPHDTMILEVIDENQKKATIEFPLEEYKGSFANFGNIRGYPLLNHTKIMQEEKIGYIKFNIFLFQNAQKAIENIKEMTETKGIIIDLRNNPGGIGHLACAIAKEFCTENYLLGTQNTTADNGISEIKFNVLAQPNPFKGKVVILINEGSASTSEVMALGMQVNKSAYVIGENSKGLALPSVIIKLSEGSTFQYPVGDFKAPNGASLEGKGVTPDLAVKLNPADLAKGIDNQLKAAVDYIKKN